MSQLGFRDAVVRRGGCYRAELDDRFSQRSCGMQDVLLPPTRHEWCTAASSEEGGPAARKLNAGRRARMLCPLRAHTFGGKRFQLLSSSFTHSPPIINMPFSSHPPLFPSSSLSRPRVVLRPRTPVRDNSTAQHNNNPLQHITALSNYY